MDESIEEREKLIKDLCEQNTMLARNQLLCEADLCECREFLLDVVNQACQMSNGMLDSMALSSYAEALRYLAKHGLVEIKSEYGRRVIATVVVDLKKKE
jgi:hypothetical protein